MGRLIRGAALSALLAGCAADGPPTSAPTSTPSTTATSSPQSSSSSEGASSSSSPSCSVSPSQAESALRAATALRSSWMVPAPEIPSEVACCVALEMARSPSVASAWSGLDARKPSPPEGAVEVIAEQGAACSLVALLWVTDIDVNLQAARALAKVPEVTHPLALPFLLSSIERLAVFVEGSEEATLHGRLHDVLFDSMGILTGVISKHKRGQDPDGLRVAIPNWRVAIDVRPADFVEDAKGRRIQVPIDARDCSRDDECDAVYADCSNLRCIGVRADRAAPYGGKLECDGYTGDVGNYDCLPRFHIESPRCEAGRCSTRRVPK